MFATLIRCTLWSSQAGTRHQPIESCPCISFDEFWTVLIYGRDPSLLVTKASTHSDYIRFGEPWLFHWIVESISVYVDPKLWSKAWGITNGKLLVMFWCYLFYDLNWTYDQLFKHKHEKKLDRILNVKLLSTTCARFARCEHVLGTDFLDGKLDRI